MARILIFYSPFGSGHLSASQALASAFRTTGEHIVVVEDIFEHVGSALRTVITNIYKQLSEKAPLLYEMYYDGTDVDELSFATTSNLLTDTLYTPFLSRLTRFIEKMAPDAIVCTQQFPLAVVSILKQQGRITQPIYVVVTDFMVHASWIAPEVAGYFVAHAQTAYVLARRGVDPARIFPTGIPVKLELTQPKDPQAVRSQHNLPLDRPIITLFGGGIEPKRVRLMVQLMVAEGTRPALLVTVAGRNADLTAALMDLTGNDTIQLWKLGTIDYVDDLIVASDVVITKAGGLIVSEVLARSTPLIIIDPIPGQEEWNADFVSAAGAGLQLRMPESVPAATRTLLSDSHRLAQLGAQAARLGHPSAALEIAEHILRDVQRLPGRR